MLNEVQILEAGRERRRETATLQLLGLDDRDPYPLDVPLHDVAWSGPRTLPDDAGAHLPLIVHRVRIPIVVPLGTGGRIVARPGDWLLRTPSGHYSVVRGG